MAKNKNNMSIATGTEISQSLNPEMVAQLVENQAKELELRAQELSIQKQQDDHGFEFSKKALETQLEDRKLQREHNQHMQRSRYILISFLSVMFSGIVIMALRFNKDAIAIEIIKAAGYMLAGGLGGYGLGKKKERFKSMEDETQFSVSDSS